MLADGEINLFLQLAKDPHNVLGQVNFDRMNQRVIDPKSSVLADESFRNLLLETEDVLGLILDFIEKAGGHDDHGVMGRGDGEGRILELCMPVRPA